MDADSVGCLSKRLRLVHPSSSLGTASFICEPFRFNGLSHGRVASDIAPWGNFCMAVAVQFAHYSCSVAQCRSGTVPLGPSADRVPGRELHADATSRAGVLPGEPGLKLFGKKTR